MIEQVKTFPFQILSSERSTGSSAAEGNDFLRLLTQSLEKTRPAPTPASSVINPTSLAPYAANVEASAEVPEEPESPMKEVIHFVLKQEGSAYVHRDGGSGESSKYGVLESTARGYGFKGSIRNLTRQQAEAIYEKMWKESGAEKLPRDLAVVHFDTYINSPAAARRMLKACGGDTEEYLGMRSQRYLNLAARRPERFAKYVNGWMNRIERVRDMAAAYNDTAPTTKAT